MRQPPRRTWRRSVLCLLTGCLFAACKRGETVDLNVSAVPSSWENAHERVVPRPGMVWIPKGLLLAGTPPDQVPRVPDAEMAGEQVSLGGYYIDVYLYPNEAGAIPTTNVTQAEAAAACESAGKRLCSELELERACKGPENTTYVGSQTYRPSACETGTKRAITPNGYHGGCRSAFGVHDLIGSASTWTRSPWGRGTEGLITLRGGNGVTGELVARCANGQGEVASKRSPEIGFRCCAGELNTFEVVLAVKRGTPLRYRVNDDALNQRFTALVREKAQDLVEGDMRSGAKTQPLADVAGFSVERSWDWHPLGNEALVLGGGCGRPGPRRRCGVMVARMREDGLSALGWLETGKWQPTVSETETSRELHVFGGDDNGAFRKRLSYEWGRVGVGPAVRKKKRGRKYVYESPP